MRWALHVLGPVWGFAKAKLLCNKCASSSLGILRYPASIVPLCRVHTVCLLYPLERSSRHSIPITFSSSTMATQRGPEYNQMFPNAYVLLLRLSVTVLILTYHSTPPSASQSARRGPAYVNPFFCVVMLVCNRPRTALKSPNPTENNPLDNPNNVSRS